MQSFIIGSDSFSLDVIIMLETYSSTSYSDSDADAREVSLSSCESVDKSIQLESLLLRIKELEEEIHPQDEESVTQIQDELSRTRAKMKILQEDIDSMTKEGILNKEASITLAMITARVGLMFVASPFSGFGVGVDAICILYVIYQLYRIASSEK